jgi:hypothetical protein
MREVGNNKLADGPNFRRRRLAVHVKLKADRLIVHGLLVGTTRTCHPHSGGELKSETSGHVGSKRTGEERVVHL